MMLHLDKRVDLPNGSQLIVAGTADRPKEGEGGHGWWTNGKWRAGKKASPNALVFKLV